MKTHFDLRSDHWPLFVISLTTKNLKNGPRSKPLILTHCNVGNISDFVFWCRLFLGRIFGRKMHCERERQHTERESREKMDSSVKTYGSSVAAR